MKILLSLSFFLNLVLLSKIYIDSQKPPLERIVIEKVPAVVPNNVQPKTESSAKVMQQGSVENPQTPDIASKINLPNEDELQDHLEKIGTARNQFFEKENIDSLTIEKISKLKTNFVMKQKQMMNSFPAGNISLDQRHSLSQLEEKYRQDLAKVMGEEKFEKFESFRKKFNQDLENENPVEPGQSRVIVPMDI